MPPITPSSNLDSVVNQMNQNIAQQNTSQITQIFKDDTGTRRVLLGKGANGFYGMKVSQPTYDVFSASNDQLIFNSGQNTFKIVQSGIINIPSATLSKGGTSQYGFVPGTTVQVAHGLSFTPAIVAFVLSGGVYVPTPWTFTNGVGSSSFSQTQYRVAVDGTYVYGISEIFGYNATVTDSGSTAKYYLLQETAS